MIKFFNFEAGCLSRIRQILMQNKNISKAKMLDYINSSKVTLFKVPITEFCS